MARKDQNRVTVSGTVSPALGEFLEDYRWKNRLNRSAVVGNALAAWAKSEGFEEPAAESADESADADADAENADVAPVESEPVKAGAKRVR